MSHLRLPGCLTCGYCTNYGPADCTQCRALFCSLVSSSRTMPVVTPWSSVRRRMWSWVSTLSGREDLEHVPLGRGYVVSALLTKKTVRYGDPKSVSLWRRPTHCCVQSVTGLSQVAVCDHFAALSAQVSDGDSWKCSLCHELVTLLSTVACLVNRVFIVCV